MFFLTLKCPNVVKHLTFRETELKMKICFFLALKCPNVIKHLTFRETERYAKEDNSDKCKISCKEQISFWTHSIFDQIYQSEQTSSLLPIKWGNVSANIHTPSKHNIIVAFL